MGSTKRISDMKEFDVLERNNRVYEEKEASKAVQAFINNISFPASLDELKVFIYEHGCFNVEDILQNDREFWTVPKWSKAGDIVFFMHSKTAISKITSLTTKLNKTKYLYSTDEYELMSSWLKRGRSLYNRYGGKIFAIGRVTGEPVYENYQDDDEVPFHWSSRIYADIDSVVVLENPIDISEFNSFILVTRGGAITPVLGESFEKLRSVIGSKNKLPRYFRESIATPVPLREINKSNWLQIAGQYRRSFFLEIQFRSFYVDYLLPLLGDQKKIYRECRCVKKSNPDSFVDNIIKLNGRYLPVEVKLDINAEADIKGQVQKYCDVEKCYLANKELSFIDYTKMYADKVVIIDTYNVYLYDQNRDSVMKIYDLDDLKEESDVQALRKTIVGLL